MRSLPPIDYRTRHIDLDYLQCLEPDRERPRAGTLAALEAALRGHGAAATAQRSASSLLSTIHSPFFCIRASALNLSPGVTRVISHCRSLRWPPALRYNECRPRPYGSGAPAGAVHRPPPPPPPPGPLPMHILQNPPHPFASVIVFSLYLCYIQPRNEVQSPDRSRERESRPGPSPAQQHHEHSEAGGRPLGGIPQPAAIIASLGAYTPVQLFARGHRRTSLQHMHVGMSALKSS